MFDPKVLLPYYGTGAGPERIGFVLADDTVVETVNVCDDPMNGFDFRGEDILEYAITARASWHTHPNVSSNLSEEDRRSFLDWPDMGHYIIGNDGVTLYYVHNGSVIRAATHPFPRPVQEPLPRGRRGRRANSG